MHTIKCPFCGGEVKLVSYGDGWIGLCCDKIVYNSSRLPQEGENEGDRLPLTDR